MTITKKLKTWITNYKRTKVIYYCAIVPCRLLSVIHERASKRTFDTYHVKQRWLKRVIRLILHCSSTQSTAEYEELCQCLDL